MAWEYPWDPTNGRFFALSLNARKRRTGRRFRQGARPTGQGTGASRREDRSGRRERTAHESAAARRRLRVRRFPDRVGCAYSPASFSMAWAMIRALSISLSTSTYSSGMWQGSSSPGKQMPKATVLGMVCE